MKEFVFTRVGVLVAAFDGETIYIRRVSISSDESERYLRGSQPRKVMLDRMARRERERRNNCV